jgi:hypothetical protein
MTTRWWWAVLLAALAWWPIHAQASQVCENVQIGVQPAGNGIAETPIFENRCRWVAGAVAVDVQTRAFSSAWNYGDAQQAMDRALRDCGSHCAALGFFEDFAWVAIAEDDRAYGISAQSAQDAIARCQSAGGQNCEVVIGASSTAESLYWYFGAVAYDAATGKSGAVKRYARRRDAAAAAKAECGSENCWPYAFQGGYGAIAKSADGQLFGAWSESSRGLLVNAGKEAKKACKKATGDKDCEVVVKGGAR